jgi:uncharacterized SAM-binding protein YcdF (DUF218 family)
MRAPYDVIVVLGAALLPDGRLGYALAGRVDGAIRAYHAGRATRLLMTGRYEARAMRDHAVGRGVPERAILLEETALTTRQNALASALILERERLARVLLVTQPYHMRRSLAAFRRVGVEAAPLDIPEIAPVGQRLREVVATLAYAWRGWLRF